MDATPQPSPPTFYTAEQLIDLRRKVLAGEEVSDDELRTAIDTLTANRGVAPPSKTKAPAVKIAGGMSLAEKMAKFKAGIGK